MIITFLCAYDSPRITDAPLLGDCWLSGDPTRYQVSTTESSTSTFFMGCVKSLFCCCRRKKKKVEIDDTEMVDLAPLMTRLGEEHHLMESVEMNIQESMNSPIEEEVASHVPVEGHRVDDDESILSFSSYGEGGSSWDAFIQSSARSSTEGRHSLGEESEEERTIVS